MFDWYIWKEILFCLLVAGLLGAIIGYLLRHLMGGNQLAELENSWKERFDRLNLELDGAKASLKAEGAKLAEMTRLRGELDGKLGEANGKIGAYEAELGDLRLKLPQLDADLAAKVAALAAATAALAKCKSDGEGLAAQLTAKQAEIDGLLPLREEIEKLKREIVVRGESEKTLSARVGELQLLVPKLRDTETRLTTVTAEKDGEIAKLAAQVAGIAALTAEIASLSGG